MDKNDFRYLKQGDLIEHKPWYRDLYESIKEDVKAMLELIDGEKNEQVRK